MTTENTNLSSVQMEDGRTVEFTGKKKLLKKESFADDKGHPHIRLDFVNGATRTFKLPHKLLARFAMHGAEQKFGDSIAGLQDAEDAVLAVDAIIERLSTGEESAWNARKEGDSMAGTSILAKALVAYTGKSVEQIKAFLAAKSLKEKMALRNSSKVKPFVDALEAEKAAKSNSVDTNELLGELEAV